MPMTQRDADMELAEGTIRGLILEDVESGLVPESVNSFSALHGYVDANGYMQIARPQRESEDYDTYTEIVNELEGDIDEWLRTGML